MYGVKSLATYLSSRVNQSDSFEIIDYQKVFPDGLYYASCEKNQRIVQVHLSQEKRLFILRLFDANNDTWDFSTSSIKQISKILDGWLVEKVTIEEMQRRFAKMYPTKTDSSDIDKFPLIFLLSHAYVMEINQVNDRGKKYNEILLSSNMEIKNLGHVRFLTLKKRLLKILGSNNTCSRIDGYIDGIPVSRILSTTGENNHILYSGKIENGGLILYWVCPFGKEMGAKYELRLDSDKVQWWFEVVKPLKLEYN